MMRTTVSTQPQIIIVVCCITLRRSAYGAWGNYSVHDNKGVKNTSPTFIGHINPLRYRGYYYDRETRLYYLQSRLCQLPVHQRGWVVCRQFYWNKSICILCEQSCEHCRLYW